MADIRIKDKEFVKISSFMRELIGINLKPEKKVLVENRLAKRIRFYELNSYSEYFDIVMSNKVELQEMINLLTTNETNFFRQINHYDFLEEEIVPKIGNEIKVWSAAASNGAEGYSIAMVLDEWSKVRNFNYKILLSDVNESELNTAMEGVYPIKYTKDIQQKYLKRYCLKGTGKYKDYFSITDELKDKMYFMKVNLNENLPGIIGECDLIFLRNILIYFDNEKKKQIVENVITRLKKGGYLFIGHSETLNKITTQVKPVKPTIYKKT
ncbi:MAG: protein-glutamate O-methyltransferase CheR [Candidatus Delongbacteria bacterium]|nr:protein-glutamate O-methyltransferase CheR [Candidatus Delongbacteria bacterium]MBN2833799.1 protein-glutamate O-methyltransferase CheR [Candidatus Delongbacteria bacterium]